MEDWLPLCLPVLMGACAAAPAPPAASCQLILSSHTHVRSPFLSSSKGGDRATLRNTVRLQFKQNAGLTEPAEVRELGGEGWRGREEERGSLNDRASSNLAVATRALLLAFQRNRRQPAATCVVWTPSPPPLCATHEEQRHRAMRQPLPAPAFDLSISLTSFPPSSLCFFHS